MAANNFLKIQHKICNKQLTTQKNYAIIKSGYMKGAIRGGYRVMDYREMKIIEAKKTYNTKKALEAEENGNTELADKYRNNIKHYDDLLNEE